MSALADRMSAIMSTGNLLPDIETFLAETGMGPSYFGKQAAGNSEIVSRLRAGGRIWPETEKHLRDFMDRRRSVREDAA